VRLRFRIAADLILSSAALGAFAACSDDGAWPYGTDGLGPADLIHVPTASAPSALTFVLSGIAMARSDILEVRARSPYGATPSASVTLAGTIRRIASTGLDQRVYAATTQGVFRIDFGATPAAVTTLDTDPASGVAVMKSGSTACVYYGADVSHEIRRHCRTD
jgi:hypothetical protein